MVKRVVEEMSQSGEFGALVYFGKKMYLFFLSIVNITGLGLPNLTEMFLHVFLPLCLLLVTCIYPLH